MNVSRITLCAFRGYPEETTFEFSGSNALINGANGSGKTSLLEAIEYLLTGKIHRLHGKNTAGITKNQHYPTRGCDPDDTFVEAEFSNEDGTNVTARREFTGGFTTDPSPPPEEFNDLQNLAEKQLHKLTRADLVNLIHATPSDRGDRINSLLDLKAINKRRKQLRRLEKKRFGRNLKDIRNQLDDLQSQLKRRLDISELNDNEILKAVNEARSVLGGEPLPELSGWDEPDFRDDLSGPEAQKLSVFYRDDVSDRLEDLQEWLDGMEPAIREQIQEVDRLVRAIAADEANTNINHLHILEKGSELIDHKTTECPLCGVEWKPEELEKNVEQRRKELDRIAQRRDDLQSLQAEINHSISQFTNNANQLISIIREEANDELVSKLERYSQNLKQLSDEIATADEIETESEARYTETFQSLPSQEATDAIQQISSQIPDKPNQSELEAAWQDLKETERDLREIRSLRADASLAEDCRDVCQEMKISLNEARDDAVDAVYRRIEDSFAELYGAINPDEKNIDVRLSQTNAGVSFRVGFFGDDIHPAQALHSEGHQDVMGLCLFMALSREASAANERYVLLDDVVMSVDRQHLREIANIIQSTVGQEFQVIITTHDEEWEGILGQTGTVPVNNQITLEDWDLESGPNLV